MSISTAFVKGTRYITYTMFSKWNFPKATVLKSDKYYIECLCEDELGSDVVFLGPFDTKNVLEQHLILIKDINTTSTKQ